MGSGEGRQLGRMVKQGLLTEIWPEDGGKKSPFFSEADGIIIIIASQHPPFVRVR